MNLYIFRMFYRIHIIKKILLICIICKIEKDKSAEIYVPWKNFTFVTDEVYE